MTKRQSAQTKVQMYGCDILCSSGMQAEKQFLHHGNINVYQHSVDVAVLSLLLARGLRVSVDECSLVRGALLHDYYLYDWHDPDPSHRLHGLHHAHTALCNAEKDFCLNLVEKDIIRKHMFPLNLALPRYRESVLVCIADKLSAMWDYWKQAPHI